MSLTAAFTLGFVALLRAFTAPARLFLARGRVGHQASWQYPL